MQEKFTTALRKLAEERGLELIVEHTYPNSGFYSLQPQGTFKAVLRIPFGFHTGYSTFAEGVGDPGPLGHRPCGAPWSCVRGGDHDQVLARITEILADGERGSPSRCGELVGAAR